MVDRLRSSNSADIHSAHESASPIAKACHFLFAILVAFTEYVLIHVVEACQQISHLRRYIQPTSEDDMMILGFTQLNLITFFVTSCPALRHGWNTEPNRRYVINCVGCFGLWWQ